MNFEGSQYIKDAVKTKTQQGTEKETFSYSIKYLLILKRYIKMF